MVRKSRIEQREETRRRLVESAGNVFARTGFEAAAIDVITDEAGYSRGAFYSNFESKDDLFLELMAEHVGAEISTLRSRLASIERVEDLAPAIERRYRVLIDDSSWCLLTTEFQLYAMRGGRRAAEFAQMYEDYRTQMGEVLAELFGRIGISTQLSPYEFGVSLIALSHGLALQRAANGNIEGSLTPRALALFFQAATAQE